MKLQTAKPSGVNREPLRTVGELAEELGMTRHQLVWRSHPHPGRRLHRAHAGLRGQEPARAGAAAAGVREKHRRGLTPFTVS